MMGLEPSAKEILKAGEERLKAERIEHERSAEGGKQAGICGDEH
jgi:hypothetical protein